MKLWNFFVRLDSFFENIVHRPNYEVPVTTLPMNQPMPETAPQTPQINPDTLLPDWSITVASHHNVRVIADLEGLSYVRNIVVIMPDGTTQYWSQKDIFTACVMQESGFDINATHLNTDGSTDWGLCQYNDNPKNGWIGVGDDQPFPNGPYCQTHPEASARVMARYYKHTVNLTPWSSYHTGAYKRYLGKV